jgi:hypothetical protein
MAYYSRQPEKPKKPVEKVTFPKILSSAGSRKGNYFLSLRVLGSGNRT